MKTRGQFSMACLVSEGLGKRKIGRLEQSFGEDAC